MQTPQKVEFNDNRNPDINLCGFCLRDNSLFFMAYCRICHSVTTLSLFSAREIGRVGSIEEAYRHVRRRLIGQIRPLCETQFCARHHEEEEGS